MCIAENEINKNSDTPLCYSDEFHNGEGCFYFISAGKLICCITIIGQIEGHYLLSEEIKTTKYENIIPRIINASQNDNISGILLILNTIGGDIEAGLAISELLSGISKPKVSIVLGGGHSIGIPLAVSADKSFITPTASMTIHPVRMSGLIMGVPQQLEYFQNMQERIINFVVRHSSIKAERFRELMLSSGKIVSDFGSVLFGDEAVKEGLIDKVGSISDAISTLTELINFS